MRNEDEHRITIAKRIYFAVGMALGATIMHIWLGGGIW